MQLEEVGHKVLAINNGDRFVHHVKDLGFKLFRHRAVNGFHRLRDVQLAAHAGHVDAIPVVDAISGVAGLLNFGHHDAGAKGMNTSSRNEKDIVLVHLLVVEDRLQPIVFQHIGIIHSRHLSVEAHDEFSILVGLHHIPHFGLAIAQTAFFSQLIVGMNLHREPVVGIYNLQ